MTPLRQRMIEDLQLQGLAAETQEADVRAVKQLAQHYTCTCGAVQVSQVA
jgi:hypothetical protein